MILAAAFLCTVASVTDGDTFRCADGTRVRIAGIDANEKDGTCHHVCATMSAVRARDYLAGLTTGRTLSCVALGRSYKRIVARCSVNGIDLSCAMIAAGGAVRWERYWKRYRMGECR